jgi:phosphoribosylaminoimidazole-succinocarboxamide synthase
MNQKKAMKADILLHTDFPELQLVKKGKVRDIYDVGEYYLIVSSDRISAFDVIMDQGVPYKGKLLNNLSKFWFDFTKNVIPNHCISTDFNEFPDICKRYKDQLIGRSMLVKKIEIIPLECIVRGYLAGSAWKEYQKNGSISGVKLPVGIHESEKLNGPIFTPSTKAEIGLHDENISLKQAEAIADKDTLEKIKIAALEIYSKVSEYALVRGIIIADTKMEFGFYKNELLLADELLTPDSSRFWSQEKYSAGRNQVSLDKQFLRDYLISINFNNQPPPPVLPEEIIVKTSEKYLEAFYKLTGKPLF